MPEIVEDIRALIDASGAQRVHLVGHDWGAAAAELSDRIATLTSFSVPHPSAFLKGPVTSRQGLLSWYMYFFQLPWLPERLLLGRNGAAERMSKQLQSGGQTPQAADIATHRRWHCQLEQSEGDFRRFASATHQVACDV